MNQPHRFDHDEAVRLWLSDQFGSRAELAKHLGISRRPLNKLLERLGVPMAPEFQQTKPCECGSDDCTLERRPGDSNYDWNKRKYRDDSCRNAARRRQIAERDYDVASRPESAALIDEGRMLVELRAAHPPGLHELADARMGREVFITRRLPANVGMGLGQWS